MVVDANVWVGRAEPTQTHAATSRRWLQRQARAGVAITVPNLCLAEVAGSVTRLTADFQRGLSAVRVIVLGFPGIQVFPLDEVLGIRAMELAARLMLRGSDAVYVALAESLGLPLVTWDRQVLARGPAVVTVLQPS